MRLGIGEKAKSVIAWAVRERNTEPTVRRLTAAQLSIVAQPLTLERDKHYVQVRLKSLRIVNSRIAWKKYYGCIHTNATLADSRTGEAQFQSISTPSKLAGPDPKHADRILLKDVPVLGPVPYRGGNMTVEIGLFAVQSSDLAEPFLDVLMTMSKAAGVSFVTAAAPFVEPLKKGAERLLGLENHSTLAVGLAHGFSPVETGYYLVTDAPSHLVDGSSLRFDESFRLQFEKNDKLADYPYFVFSIEAETRRADWASIPDLRSAHDSLRALLHDPKTTSAKAEEAYTFFKRLALTSPDLVGADADTLVAEENARLQKAFGQGRAVAGRKKGFDIGPFESLGLYATPSGTA
ncbi:hypothetical protein GCM10011611_00670 [Aliidongia dinghuensis]|uniref:Uncharacterized protein n=1 Tax=Aliidongia dinghuensis TaxID=1867774 RepID=A0A8J2YQ20_9PROT|nr:hypothetical protein [Aliidongia dinghuensis]GGE99003.1 hypothetical protein GCM10011611_00670 [Aliidongia dinghuensis]